MNLIITDDIFDSLRTGDEQVLDKIMDVNGPKVYAFIRKMTKSDMDAEELTQDVFVQVWENREEIHSPETFYAYLFTVARNVTINFLRKNKPETVDIEDLVIVGEVIPKVESIYDMKELYLAIMLEVDKMPPQRKKIFEMSRFEGMTHEQIAEALGISRNTVSNHITVALKQLKDALYSMMLLLMLLK